MTFNQTASGSEGGLAFCTVISKNYISQARALAESLRLVHPESPLYVLLVDRIDGYFDPAAEPFRTVLIENLAIPDLPRFCFQYNVLELNTAAKPYLLAHLLRTYGPRKLVYFDPDILVLRRLDALASTLDRSNIVLTPHITQPYPLDGKRLNELTILLAGSYNLGFIGVANTPEVGRFLAWWQDRLYDGCQENRPAGMFVDQRWMDLAAHYFEGVRVLREPGYNVAYWNLHYRRLTVGNGEVRVNGQPVYFVHFSGFNPSCPDVVSRHQNRLTMDDLGEGRYLFARYVDALRRHGNRQSSDWPYAFGSFDDGAPVPDLARRLYLRMGNDATRFGNPFVTDGSNPFVHWLTSDTDDQIAPLLGHIHQSRPDLLQAFPDVNGAGREAFREWAQINRRQLTEDYAFSEPVLQRLGLVQAPATPVALQNVREVSKAGGPPRAFGVNLTGYFESEKGVGEAARAVLRALGAAGIPYVLNNVRDVGSQNEDSRYSRFNDANPYAVNIFTINADAVPHVLPGLPEYLAGRYNVGIWNWELSEFPECWDGSFDFFDEIWAPSTFCQRSFAGRSPIPVHYVPYSICPAEREPPVEGRDFFGLPEGVFVFLFTFDCHSYVERKNPQGALEAFVRAFGDRRDVMLVLKAMHAKDGGSDYASLRDACECLPNVRLLDQIYTRAQAQALMMLCDAYVSLHRAEGFGLTIAEAMAMGKPVVATGYSANADWMTVVNSRPVRYRLRALDHDVGPYRRGALWAEPDVEDAARQMFRLVEDRELAARVGARGRQDITRLLAPARVGELIYSRLASLVAGAAGGATILTLRRGSQRCLLGSPSQVAVRQAA
jgi:glycosyltransferase involved in cell wall biosynthesis